MKRWKQVLVSAGLMAAMEVSSVYAAGWQWLDNNNDGVSECYYIQDDGTALLGTVTPDGHTVDEQGAWIVDGVVQTQNTEPAQAMEPARYSSQTTVAPRITRSSMQTSQLGQFRYILYSPANPTDNMALVVYLHGHGLGDKLNDLEKDIEPLKKEAKKTSDAFILAPLLPPELDYGRKGMWPGIDPSIMELIESVITEYHIDRDRVSMIGGSMGADSAIQIAAAHPDVFSCCVGIAPFHENSPMAKWEEGWGEKLKTTPFWFFVEDETSARSLAKTTSEGIIAAGGQAWVEVKEGTTHKTVGQQVTDRMGVGGYGIYNWLVSVRKIR